MRRKTLKIPGKIYLSAREKEILSLIAQGLCSKQIALKLRISLNTVRNHRSNMLSKTSKQNFCELLSAVQNFSGNNNST